MFSGIVEKVGTVVHVKQEKRSRVLGIKAGAWKGGLSCGESICVNGVCLTVRRSQGGVFVADVVPETLRSTTIGSWKSGERVNLERSLRLGDRLGGHFVFGHVDGVGKIENKKIGRGGLRLKIKAPAAIIRYLVSKGSIAVDGISLTVQKVFSSGFEVAIIPHTAKQTVIGDKTVGELVNLEADMLAKFAARASSYPEGKK